MGVCNCCRKGCENVMCTTYIEHIGYICMECIEDFKKQLDNQIGHNRYQISDMHQYVKKFIESPKGQYPMDKMITVDEFFEQ